MNMTIRKEALRDQRAKMLAAAPDWRASDARVNPRVAIGSILAMWFLYFLITTGLGILAGAEQWEYAGRRALVVVAGILCTFVLYQLIQRVQPRGFGARLAVALGAAVPLVAVYATINLLVFFYWFPGTDAEKIIAEVQSKFPISWETVLILDSSIRWYFFFAVWAALYVAFGYANEMRAVERRANHFRIEAQAAQLRALHYQVNPHFLFNTLNSLSTLVLKGSKSEAETMIMNLSSFLRSSLAVDPEQLVSLDEEIALQRLYLDIEQVRFPDRLHVEVTMPNELENACVPVLILQPIIENAIKYGVAPSKGTIAIRLTASSEYGLLVLRIENDIDPKAPIPAPGTGLGLGNVRERLLTRYGPSAGCEWGRSDTGGFFVSLWLPLARERC
ncbi:MULTISPECIES: histidine kinase [unclassified Sphingopyxis]|uniref:sensor histidine kinase n=2 Tax=unclassified Sphingopyxis TaxID=2614943 RepID=UPI000731B7BD|nr:MULTISPECIES: histidine kinase [unclassified Sphingopyxis]KTE50932.1 histidine kinase [Sphingopyxis sp. H071]KTE59646.1 histidine kinase [Sphingopyxis sp. H107]KTE71903.1 histidine kinase [Sphingopyxis sp. H081]KTE24404.1 histidine kinase [Sphingopyxis sp. H057]KTE52075.1 histidine kinase [Sphingopyxis sp. H073]